MHKLLYFIGVLAGACHAGTDDDILFELLNPSPPQEQTHKPVFITPSANWQATT